MEHNIVYILDFGSQYTQLIARKVRELNVYCEIVPFTKYREAINRADAIILSGSPFSCLDENAPLIDLSDLVGKIPVLAVCYGAQLAAKAFGGVVDRSSTREFGRAHLDIKKADAITNGISPGSQVWMSHGDSVHHLPESFEVIAATENIPVAIFKYNRGEDAAPFYGLQFHPEVHHSNQGQQVLSNFLFTISGLRADWTPASYVSETVAYIKERVGDEHVLMALSGGVDSTVAATLISRAIGDQLHCVFVDNGLLRKDEFQEVLDSYKGMGLNVHGIDASSAFWDALDGAEDPEEKRKIIGNLFIKIFEEEARSIEEIKWLGQGTIYPDVIESVSVHGPSVTIKSHHNVGGLPEKLELKIIEPLRSLFKDEVRRIGKELEITGTILNRHPFPGPGLAIRIIGAVSEERVKLLQEADHVYISILKEYDQYDKIWQAGAILLPIQSVGVMGDERTYENVVALRAVNSVDGMTAAWSQIPYDILAKISTTIINKVKGINRVVYDISTKPPATIEWE
jgi:GMP synthase (glutamine-hydrolysing)